MAIAAAQEERTRRLGIHPEFEGIVIPREVIRRTEGIEERVREAILWDTSEAAFAYFNSWSLTDKQRHLVETLRYIREGNDTHTLPILGQWADKLSGKSVDEAAEEMWQHLEIGVRRRHEGMDKFLYKHAIRDSSYQPRMSRAGIWRAKVVRRGDERKEPARDVRLWDFEITAGGVDIARIGFHEPSPLYRDNFGRERRHDEGSSSLNVAGYHVFALVHYIKSLTPQQKVDLGLPMDYDLFSPFDFTGKERLIMEAVARRYLPIYYKLEGQRNIFAVSNFLNDHPEIFSRHADIELKRNLAFVGVGKLLFDDLPHRVVLDSLDDFFVKERLYRFNGFATDFREFGEKYQTVSTVYTRQDMSRTVHLIYDGRFNVPPLILFKIRYGEWAEEQRSQGRSPDAILQTKPQRSPFERFGQWYTVFDRHTQQPMVAMLTIPGRFILDQYLGLEATYRRSLSQSR